MVDPGRGGGGQQQRARTLVGAGVEVDHPLGLTGADGQQSLAVRHPFQPDRLQPPDGGQGAVDDRRVGGCDIGERDPLAVDGDRPRTLVGVGPGLAVRVGVGACAASSAPGEMQAARTRASRRTIVRMVGGRAHALRLSGRGGPPHVGTVTASPAVTGR